MPDPLPPDSPEPTPVEPPEVPPTPEPSQRRWWRGWKFWLVVLGVTPVLLFVLYTVSVLNWAYSEGTRAGYLQKFSKKGWICKTWEGELALTTVPGVAPTLWSFTVRSDAAARQLNLAIGRRVLLFYREHRGIPSRCFGETSYFVDSVKIVP
ncbi:MAG TPA: hypothetical protein VGQ69_03330 [Gemmatimonadales bacterium]|jgi:hypothetical protein|nr:hypothetical protein [Gemmatimonadales bacterium]